LLANKTELTYNPPPTKAGFLLFEPGFYAIEKIVLILVFISNQSNRLKLWFKQKDKHG